MARSFLHLAALLLIGASARAQTVDATAFGVVADSLVDNTPFLQRAIRHAVRDRQPGRWAGVRLPAGTTYYRGVLKLDADSLEIVGCGGAVLTRDTVRTGPDAGEVYYPVRRADAVDPSRCVSVVRVLPRSFGLDSRGRARPTRWIVWARGAAARRWQRLRLRDLIMDGNLEGNLGDGTSPMGLRAIRDKKSFLQDGVGHTALAANGHDRTELCSDGPRILRLNGGRTLRQTGNQIGTLIEVERVVISGYAATGLVGNRCTRWRLSTVRGEHSPYNHVFYHTDGGVRSQDQEQMGDRGPLDGWGGAENVTLSGAAWTYWVSQSGLHVRNLVFEDPAPNPLRSNEALFDARWGTVTVEGFTEADPLPAGLGRGTGGTLVVHRDAGTVPPDSALVLPPPR